MVAAPLLDSSSGWAWTAISRNRSEVTCPIVPDRPTTRRPRASFSRERGCGVRFDASARPETPPKSTSLEYRRVLDRRRCHLPDPGRLRPSFARTRRDDCEPSGHGEGNQRPPRRGRSEGERRLPRRSRGTGQGRGPHPAVADPAAHRHSRRTASQRRRRRPGHARRGALRGRRRDRDVPDRLARGVRDGRCVGLLGRVPAGQGTDRRAARATPSSTRRPTARR